MAIVGQGITAYPQPDDALNENSKNPVQNKVIAGNIKELKNNNATQDERITGLGQATTATTIGPASIATFEAPTANMPLKGLTINIEPVQAAGTPSPENPLPISGWTGVNVFDDPKYAIKINWNQIRTDSAQTRTLDGITTAYNPQTHLFTITNNSRTTSYNTGSTQCIVSNVDPIPGHRYALLGEYHSGVCVSAVNDNNTLRTTTNVGHIMTMPSSTATVFKLRITSSYDFASAHPVGDVYSFYLNIVDITQLLGEEAAATATYNQIAEMFPKDWYPYNAGEINCVSAVNGDPHRKISVNWQNEAGAVYGGTLDTVNKKLTVTKRYALLNDTTKWTEITGTGVHTYRYMTSFPDRKKYETSYLGFICSFATADSSASFYARWSGVDTALFGFKATNGTPTLEEIKTAAANNEIAICYDLAEPLVYELADIPGFTTLIGENNIWADTGDVTVIHGVYLETIKELSNEHDVREEQVEGTVVNLNAEANTRYICGEVATLDITLPVSGICDIVFTSGSTPTVLTVSSTVKWMHGFDPTALAADTIYELNFMDGLGVVVSWT